MTQPKLITLASLLVLASVVLILGGCGSSEDATATPRPAAATAAPQATATPDLEAQKYGGQLRAQRGNTPGHLDVLQTVSSAESFPMGPIYDALIFINLGFVLEPMLAESWDIAGDSRSITFKLVEGVKFHDGTVFNAAAVKNDLDYKLNPDNKFEQRAAIATISSIEVLGEHTLKINLSQADALVLPNMAARPGFIYSPTHRDSVAPEERNLKPVGAGSFRVTDFMADDHITYERWAEGFSGGKFPYLDRLDYVIISDPAVSLASYRAGEIEMFDPTAQQAQQLKSDSSTVINSRWQEEWPMILYNPRFEPLDDIRVRKAMAYAMDRNALNQALELGEGAPRYGTIGPAYESCFDPSYRRYEFNQDEAKRLLAEAGFADGFSIGPVVWFGKQRRLPGMNLMADMMKQVGITWEIQMIDSIAASRGFRIEKKYANYHSTWGSRAPDIDTLHRDLFYSKGTVGSMWEGFVAPGVIQALDAALDNGRATNDPQTRCGFYQEAQDIINDHALGISLYTGLKRAAIRDSVKGFINSPSGGGWQFWPVWLEK